MFAGIFGKINTCGYGVSFILPQSPEKYLSFFEECKTFDSPTESHSEVINAIYAAVLCVVEVENREMLGKFNTQTLGTKRFTHHMIIDGNDERSIDVGLLSNITFRNIRTHVDDKDGTSLVLSRDCAEYELALDNGRSLWPLCNHFKSKGRSHPSHPNDFQSRRR